MIILALLSMLSLDSILNQPALSPAQCGICVMDLTHDRVVYAYNSQKVMVPASNMKLVSTGASLTFLGPEFRYTTKLAMRGAVHEGKLIGDILLIGGGDPTFTTYGIKHFIQAVKTRNINEIVGNVVVVDTYFTEMSLNGNSFRFERLPVGWAWHYLDARYAPEVSALSFHRNVVNVRMEATEAGKPALVTLQPSTQYVTLVSDMFTKEGEDSIIIVRRPESNEIYVGGGIREDRVQNIEVAVIDPAFFAGHYLREALNAENIRVHGDVVRPVDHDTLSQVIVIDSVKSEPLRAILLETNTESVNLFAETLLKTLGARFNNEGSFRAGVQVLERFLERCGADPGTVSLWDGSGLSRHNLISPYDITLVLRYMYLSKYSTLFFEMLPTSGEGTLERRFKEMKGFMRAKTGSLHAVSCLSGYLKFDDTDYCFSMMFNNYVCSGKAIEEIQERIVLALQHYLAPETVPAPIEQ
ncbi:D-alanyl-D-alanine carboxypeptidase/D-alanyl-D-alanine-endopeptidase [candidate division WOR-3 bacterium]|nr:D-alanyl-D-alanine carboxypeptidase/D-alanyl-D-alanine-endopeptidase [candidate division WOR-3 bacterium]